MTRKSLTALALSAGLFITACGQSNDDIDTAATPAPDSAMADAQDEGLGTDSSAMLPDSTSETDTDPVGSEAAAITLEPIREQDTEGLRGELACAFNAADSGETLLVARADVAEDSRAMAAVNNNGFGQQMYGEQLGGFGQIERTGGTFAGEGLVIVVDIGSDALDGSQTEQSEKAATLMVNRAAY